MSSVTVAVRSRPRASQGFTKTRSGASIRNRPSSLRRRLGQAARRAEAVRGRANDASLPGLTIALIEILLTGEMVDAVSDHVAPGRSAFFFLATP